MLTMTDTSSPKRRWLSWEAKVRQTCSKYSTSHEQRRQLCKAPIANPGTDPVVELIEWEKSATSLLLPSEP
jgi:hypothetical protein